MNFSSDTLDKQVDFLLRDISHPEDTSKERYKKLMKVLEYDKYIPDNTTLKPENNNYFNPALDYVLSNMKWCKKGWKSNNTLKNFLSQYPEYVPSNKAIEYLCSNTKDILEIGAGSGYWSYVINNNGGSCKPTDSNPKNILYSIETDSYPVTEISEDFSTTVWCEIEKGKHTIIPDYPNHDILFCHPEGLPWTEEVLELMNSSQQLILIAGWYPSPNATPFFFKKLIDNWKLKEKLPVHSSSSSHACMYVFQKN